MNKRRVTAVFSAVLIITLIYTVWAGEYNLTVQTLLTAAAAAAVYLTDRKTDFFTPPLFLSTMLFVFASMYAGKLLNMYEIIPYWDKLLHFASGFLLAEIALRLFRLSGGAGGKKPELLFAFAAASAAAGFWEIFEFTNDRLFKTAAQNNSLIDTMWDIIMGNLSAAAAVLYKFYRKY